MHYIAYTVQPSLLLSPILNENKRPNKQKAPSSHSHVRTLSSTGGISQPILHTDDDKWKKQKTRAKAEDRDRLFAPSVSMYDKTEICQPFSFCPFFLSSFLPCPKRRSVQILYVRDLTIRFSSIWLLWREVEVAQIINTRKWFLVAPSTSFAELRVDPV